MLEFRTVSITEYTIDDNSCNNSHELCIVIRRLIAKLANELHNFLYHYDLERKLRIVIDTSLYKRWEINREFEPLYLIDTITMLIRYIEYITKKRTKE